MDNLRNTWKNKPGVIILSVLLVLVIIMLLAVLLVRGIINKNETRSVAGAPVVTETIVATSADQAMAATATNTKVVATKAAPTATRPKDTPTPIRITATPTQHSPTPTKAPTEKATKTPTAKPTATDTATALPPQNDDILNNGDFDADFSDNGVASGWTPFQSDGGLVGFEAETWEPAIENGDFAQRITIANSSRQDVYAGVYQTVNVVAGESYSLTLYGQIRTPFGDVEKSDYGYRMQYAIDWDGGTDWQAIPADSWIELPWDEQLIDGDNLFFLDYATEVIPPNNKMTLFVRAWKKWPNDVGGQFTIDSFSLLGPVATMATGEALPETGGSVQHGIGMSDPRVWGSMLILLLLLGGAAWQQRHSFRR